MPIKLTPKGTGRPDYTRDVYINVEPVQTFWQRPAQAVVEVDDIPPNSYTEFDLLPKFNFKGGGTLVFGGIDPEEKTHFISAISVTASSNCLIGLELIVKGHKAQYKQGYQKIEIVPQVAIPFDELTVRVYNYGDKNINIIYCHSGYYSTVPVIERLLLQK